MLERGTKFSLVYPDHPDSRSACRGELQEANSRVLGACDLEIDDRGRVSKKEFSFVIRSVSVSEHSLEYDVERLCLGKVCLAEAQLCWQDADGTASHSCTLRPFYELPVKATPARLKEFLVWAASERLDLIYMCEACRGATVELYPDHSFFVRALYNPTSSCGGRWSVDGLHIRGQCNNAVKELEPSFDYLVTKTTRGGLTFAANLCMPDFEECIDEQGGFWLPHGRRDHADNMTLELVQGARASELFSAVALRLQSAYWPQWREAGANSLPVLIRGQPARRLRVETEIFYSGVDRAKELAEAAARLLAPVVGPVVPRPWPGSSEFAVVVVVGERAIPAAITVPE